MNNQQQQPLSNEQNVMSQPPNIMSTKDHLYVTDMLSWNLLAMKKALHWANECVDQEVKQLIETAATMHKRHYEQILTHLQPHPQQPGNQMQMPSMQQNQ